jgi:SWIM zinc finger
MTVETIEQKAHRLLLAGRLTITWVNGETIEARCEGDSGMRRLGYRKDRGWWCDCPWRSFRGKRCSHLAALMLVAGKTAKQRRSSA